MSYHPFKDSLGFKPLDILHYLFITRGFPYPTLTIINNRYFKLSGEAYHLSVGKLSSGKWIFDVDPMKPSLLLFMSEDFNEVIGYSLYPATANYLIQVDNAGGFTPLAKGPTLLDPSRVKTSSKSILYSTTLYQLGIGKVNSPHLRVYPGSFTPQGLYRAFKHEVEQFETFDWPIHGYAKAPGQEGLLLFSSAWPGVETIGYNPTRSFIIRS